MKKLQILLLALVLQGALYADVTVTVRNITEGANGGAFAEAWYWGKGADGKPTAVGAGIIAPGQVKSFVVKDGFQLVNIGCRYYTAVATDGADHSKDLDLITLSPNGGYGPEKSWWIDFRVTQSIFPDASTPSKGDLFTANPSNQNIPNEIHICGNRDKKFNETYTNSQGNILPSRWIATFVNVDLSGYKDGATAQSDPQLKDKVKCFALDVSQLVSTTDTNLDINRRYFIVS